MSGYIRLDRRTVVRAHGWRPNGDLGLVVEDERGPRRVVVAFVPDAVIVAVHDTDHDHWRRSLALSPINRARLLHVAERIQRRERPEATA